MSLPYFVWLLGLAYTCAPKFSMIMRRYGFWKYDTLTMYTSSAIWKKLQAMASAEPHWPAPVSVVSAFVPASLL